MQLTSNLKKKNSLLMCVFVLFVYFCIKLFDLIFYIFFLCQAPLWVCPDCRRNIEEEERRAAMEPSIPVSLQVQMYSVHDLYTLV